MRFEGRRVIVSGASRGIGRGIVDAFLDEGATVLATDVLADGLAAMDEEHPQADRLATHTADLASIDGARGVVPACIEALGGVDVLVNNAGGQFAAPAEEISLKGLRAVHRLNVDAVWYVTHRVATRWMIPRRHGSIFFLGFSPRRGVPMMAHSSMARSALETMAASLSSEWSRYGIRAVCVAAGLIATEGLRQYGGPEIVDELAAQVPMRRAGLPEEVAATIAFLASAGGAYITGSTVLVDGGADAWGQGEPPPEPEPPQLR